MRNEQGPLPRGSAPRWALGTERSCHSPSLGAPSSWRPINACVCVSLPQVAPPARKGPLSSLPLAILLGREPTKMMGPGQDTGPCQATTRRSSAAPWWVRGTVVTLLPSCLGTSRVHRPGPPRCVVPTQSQHFPEPQFLYAGDIHRPAFLPGSSGGSAGRLGVGEQWQQDGKLFFPTLAVCVS